VRPGGQGHAYCERGYRPGVITFELYGKEMTRRKSQEAILQCSEYGQFQADRQSSMPREKIQRFGKCPATCPAGLPTVFDEIGEKLLLPTHFKQIFNTVFSMLF
jgi:hypothetical protein